MNPTPENTEVLAERRRHGDAVEDRTGRSVMVCMGTRPEVIKLAPVVDAVAANDALDVIVVATAQHRTMLDQMLDTFDIVPDIDLDLMSKRQSLHGLTGAAIHSLGEAIELLKPAAVVVQGDTTTALCAGIAAAYAGVPVAHVEAGLRTGDRTSPFPEEINRKMLSAVCDLHFCPTAAAAENLLEEGVDPNSVFVTGNTVIDALHDMRARSWSTPPPVELPERRTEQRLIVTMHRRETQGGVQRALLQMLARVIEQHPNLEIVMPVHLNPDVRENVMHELGGHERIHLTEPLDYRSFVTLLQTADLILTDSGGLQEEAPALSIPLLVMRDTTERPEGIEAGGVRLCGTDPITVEEILCDLLGDPGETLRMAAAPNPYGDGRAAERIVEALASRLASDQPMANHLKSRQS